MTKLLQFSLFDEPPAPEPATEASEPAAPQPVTPLPEAPPPPPQPEIPDADARRHALDTTRSFLVEAPAGSGKTGLLIQRFLKLLGGDDVTDPSQLLAITFTRKATAEMRERVLAQLSAAAGAQEPANAFDRATRPLAESVLARDRNLNWRLLEEPNRLNIQTIDGVCAGITRALPVLAGAAGNLAPAEDPAPLYREAARRTLLQLGGHDLELNHALQLLLLHRDGNLLNLEGHLAAMLGSREQWIDLIANTSRNGRFDDETLQNEILPRLERALDGILCQHLTGLVTLVPAPLLAEWADLAACIASSAGDDALATPLEPCRTLRDSPEAAAHHVAQWLALKHLVFVTSGKGKWRSPTGLHAVKPKCSASEKSRLKAVLLSCREIPGLEAALAELAFLPPATYPADQWHVVKALLRALRHALSELQTVFRSRGQADFTESALLARAALRSPAAPEDLASASGLQLRHLLVDEMQDTSAGQYELLELLTRTWGHAGETVFLVGDPKQSIYSFRQARVERFLATLHSGRLGSAGLRLQVLHLTSNFRSRAGLVQAFNDDFRRIFPGQPQATLPPHVAYLDAQALRADEPGASATPRTWHATVLPYESDRRLCREAKAAQRRQTASDIREILAAWRARPLPPERAARMDPWRIAVLVRRREDLAELVPELQSAGVPYRAVEIDPLKERQEVLDLLALTRALLHPADRTAWLAVLRSPFCGLTLADLHTLAGGDDRTLSEQTLAEAIERRGTQLSPDGRQRLEAAWPHLQHAAQPDAQRTLGHRVEQAWRLFAAPAYLTAAQIENAGQFFTLLNRLESEPNGAAFDLPALEQRLERLYAAPAPVADAVELLTMHKSKGLEWDVVLVPALDGASPHQQGRLLDWLVLEGDLGDDTARVLFAPIKSKGGPGQALNTWMGRVERRRQAAERKRLFYVAATRAREELHLFGDVAESATFEVKPPQASLLEAAWPAASPAFLASRPLPQPAGELIEMPSPPSETLQTLAAVATPASYGRLERIPLAALAAPEPQAASEERKPVSSRPEGSFATRLFGNTVHTFLEHLTARRAASGSSHQALLAELPTWTPRMRAVLRAAGASAQQATEDAAEVLRALTNTLHSPEGRWLTAAHPGAASESGVTVAHGHAEPIRLRVDRSFLAGALPGETGSDYLWIIDFKTASHGQKGMDAWLEAQRLVHAPQLERYAAALAGTEPTQRLRLALFYPMLPRLLWWPFPASETPPA